MILPGCHSDSMLCEKFLCISRSLCHCLMLQSIPSVSLYTDSPDIKDRHMCATDRGVYVYVNFLVCATFLEVKWQQWWILKIVFLAVVSLIWLLYLAEGILKNNFFQTGGKQVTGDHSQNAALCPCSIHFFKLGYRCDDQAHKPK